MNIAPYVSDTHSIGQVGRDSLDHVKLLPPRLAQ